MRKIETSEGVLHCAQAEDVYGGLSDVRLVISDGPYGMSKAEWDRVKDLAAWYRPHVEAWGRVCLPSASVYLWNTARGLLTLNPLMEEMGWTFRSQVTWDKGFGYVAGRIDTESLRSWTDVTEVCGFYQRESIDEMDPITAANASDRNTIRLWLREERARAGVGVDVLRNAIDAEGAKGEMIVRHSFTPSQWWMPTFDQWAALHRAWNRHGNPTGRPYLQRAERTRTWNQALRADYEALRADYEALRVPFHHPMGVTNVWSTPMVQGADRLRLDDGTTHPCQKPLVFYERMIAASSNPGDLVLDPFAGTCRTAFAAAKLGRRWIAAEPDERWFEKVAGLIGGAESCAAVREDSLMAFLLRLRAA